MFFECFLLILAGDRKWRKRPATAAEKVLKNSG